MAAGLLWAAGVDWSRVYWGVRCLSDVLAGWVGSVGWVGGLHLLFARYFQQLRHVWGEARLYWRGPTAAALARTSPPAADAPERPANSR